MMWLVRPWLRTFDFKGRATRREYWTLVASWYVLLFILLFAAVRAAASPTVPPLLAGMALQLAGLLVLVSLVPLLSAAVRRLHDHDKSGWFLLLVFFPLFGWIYHLVMMLTPGSPDWNSYGANPRLGDGDTSDIADVFA